MKMLWLIVSFVQSQTLPREKRRDWLSAETMINTNGSDVLAAAFIWEFTDEGHDYWSSLSEKGTD